MLSSSRARCIGLLVACGLCLLAAGCKAGSLGRAGARVEAGMFQPQLAADVRFDTATLVGTNFDVIANADVDDKESIPYVSASASFTGFTLYGSAYRAKFNGTTDLAVPIDFGGTSFQLNHTLKTDFDIANYSAGVEVSLLPLETVHIGAGLGVDVFDLDVRMEQRDVALSETFDETLPIPVVSLSAEVNPIDALGAFVQARGMKARSEWIGLNSQGSQNATFVDLWGGLRGTLSYFTATVGYKWTSLDVEAHEGKADLQIKGLVGTIGIEF